PNINAALGCAQLEQLPSFLAAKQKIQQRYQQAFADNAELEMVVQPPNCQSNYWLPALKLPEDFSVSIDDCLKQLTEQGIGARPVWDLMHQLPMYKDCPRMDLTTAENLSKRLLCLPSGVSLGVDQ
ncbi:MAG: DegT/DnrJ/EryC1/StrS family aminotransferase, partial [Pseudomonadota bacterium]